MMTNGSLSVRFSPGPGLQPWESPQAPINISDAMDDLDNDCIRVSEKATENAKVLSDLLDLLLLMPQQDSASVKKEVYELE
jgi:hypothetical protein